MGPHLRDSAHGVDEKAVAAGDLDAGQAAQRAVGFNDFVLRVGEQAEGKSLLGAELRVAACAVHAHAQDDRVPRLELGQVALEAVRLDGAAGR